MFQHNIWNIISSIFFHLANCITFLKPSVVESETKQSGEKDSGEG